MPLLSTLAFLKFTRLNKQRVIIDWHNYGYSILRVNGVNKFLVAGAKAYELFFGKLAGDHHLCVSKAMATDLKHKLRLKDTPTVVYDLAT